MKPLVFAILILAGLGFIYGLIKSIQFSLKGTPNEMPSFLRQIVTVIGGVLATNLGAVLGITLNQPGGSLISKILLEGDTPSVLQMIAAYAYFVGLVIGLIGWAKLNWTEDPSKVVVLLPQLSQTLLGAVAGVLAVYLGLN